MTVSGLPILRKKNRQGRSSNRNSFITEEEALALFSQSDTDDASGKTFEQRRQTTGTSTMSSSIHARTSTWSHNRNDREGYPLLNEKHSKSDGDYLKPEPIKPPRHRQRGSTAAEYATVQSFNSGMDFRHANVVGNRKSHQQQRGRRDKAKTDSKRFSMLSDDVITKSRHPNREKHDPRHCEDCRRLNTIKSPNEPIRHCWERYYPISETTPRTSAQGFY